MRATFLLAVALALPAGARAAALPSPAQALKEAFPGASFEKRTWALSDDEMSRVEELAGSVPESRLIAGFVVSGETRAGSVALLEAHEVRSKRETLLVSIGPSLQLSRVDVLAFAEPAEYLPPPRWLAQLEGKPLGPGLELKRDIRGITGATLTARAVTAASRRCLAIAQVLRDRGPETGLPAPAPAPASAAAAAAAPAAAPAAAAP